MGNTLPRAPCANTLPCDFQTRLIELSLFFVLFFCNPHHTLPHPPRRLDHFKQTRSSSTTSSPSACRRRTTATTPPSTSWPHLRRYVSDCERPAVTAAVTFIRIKTVWSAPDDDDDDDCFFPSLLCYCQSFFQRHFSELCVYHFANNSVLYIIAVLRKLVSENKYVAVLWKSCISKCQLLMSWEKQPIFITVTFPANAQAGLMLDLASKDFSKQWRNISSFSLSGKFANFGYTCFSLDRHKHRQTHRYSKYTIHEHNE